MFILFKGVNDEKVPDPVGSEVVLTFALHFDGSVKEIVAPLRC